MLRRIAVLLLALLAFAPAAGAAERTHTIGLGFRRADAPLALRWWMQDRLGVDFGLGFDVEKASTDIDTNGDAVDDTRVEETLGRWTVEAGAPWAIWASEDLRVLLRPGVLYQSEDDFGQFTVDGLRVKLNTFAVTGEVEVELGLWKNLSVSASHGLEFRTSTLDQPNAQSTWTLASQGRSFFELGFFVYLWGNRPS